MKKNIFYLALLSIITCQAHMHDQDDIDGNQDTKVSKKHPNHKKSHEKGQWFESYQGDDDTVGKDLNPYTPTKNDSAGDYIKRPFEAGSREGATVFEKLKAKHHDDEGFFTKLGHGIQDIGAGAVATVAGAGTTATGVVTHAGRPVGAAVTLGASERDHNKDKKSKKKDKKKSKQEKQQKKKQEKTTEKKRHRTAGQWFEDTFSSKKSRKNDE